MKPLTSCLRNAWLGLALAGAIACSEDDNNAVDPEPEVVANPDFTITEATGEVNTELDQVVMSIRVAGDAGSTYPTPAGQVDGAPVIGYVFPTTLQPTDVGFDAAGGIVAMALTSHPDFDDTPLWDENQDQDYLNDGRVWHAHWVVLVNDDRVAGGLSVRSYDATDETAILPPTSPGMPIYLDSPGFQVVQQDNQLSVVIPLNRINNRREFNFDGVTVFMRVNTSDNSLPMLGVYEVYDIASGDLSLPYRVQ